MLYAPSNCSASRAEDAHPVRLLVLGLELVGQRVHDDLGVGIALEVVVPLGEQLLLEFLVVGELAVEGEREPLRLAAVVALERLGVATVTAAAGGIADVADRRRPVHPLHDRLELRAVVEPERLGHRADFLVRPDQRTAVGTIAGHARPRAARDSACPAASGGSDGRRCWHPRRSGHRLGDRRSPAAWNTAATPHSW